MGFSCSAKPGSAHTHHVQQQPGAQWLTRLRPLLHQATDQLAARHLLPCLGAVLSCAKVRMQHVFITHTTMSILLSSNRIHLCPPVLDAESSRLLRLLGGTVQRWPPGHQHGGLEPASQASWVSWVTRPGGAVPGLPASRRGGTCGVQHAGSLVPHALPHLLKKGCYVGPL